MKGDRKMHGNNETEKRISNMDRNFLPPIVEKKFLKTFNKNIISADLQKSCEMAEKIFDNTNLIK